MFPETPAASPMRRFELVTNDVDRAHQALRKTYCDHEVRLRGDPEHTVAATARRWGWANPSHFAVAYLKAYGQHPRHTLRA